MTEAQVLLQVQSKHYTCGDKYDDISTPDLQALIELSKKTLLSLQGELGGRALGLSENVIECNERLRKTLEQINLMKRLGDVESNRVTSALKILGNPEGDRDHYVYRTFLRDILLLCNQGLFLLCVASLGKDHIRRLSVPNKTQFLSYLKVNGTMFESLVVDALTKIYAIPDGDGISEVPQSNSLLISL